jgi:hypothetical protein
MGWDGQDGSGHDLDIFLNHPLGPNYLLVYKVHGVSQYGIPQHPALPYEIFSWLGFVYQKLISYEHLRYQQLIAHAKILTSSIQLIFYLAIIFVVFKVTLERKIRIKIIVWLLLLSITPLSINNSNEFQVDSMVGLSMLGFYSLILVSLSQNLIQKKFGYPLIFLASAFIGLGKTEWSIFLFVSIVFSGAYFLLARIINGFKFNFHYCPGYLVLAILLGGIFGNVLSYLFDSVNYLAGWDLILRESPRSTIFSKDGLSNFLKAFQMRSIFLWAPMILIIYGFIVLIKKNTSSALFISFCTASTFFFGYFFSTWGGDIPRYFSPAYMALIITGAGMYASFSSMAPTKWMKVGEIFIASTLFIASIQYLTSQKLLEGHHHGMLDRNFDPNCLYHIPIEALQMSEANFIAKGISIEDAELLAKDHGLRLCN